MRKAAGFTVLIVILLLPQRAFGHFQLRDGWTKLTLRPQTGTSPAIAQIIADAGGTVLYDYGASILVYVPIAQQATVTSRLAPLNVRVEPPFDDDLIYLTGATIDPRIGIPSGTDPSLITLSYPLGQQGLYVVQGIGQFTTPWFTEIYALGAKPVAIPYHWNTWLYLATPEQARLIADLPYIQFVDFLHPFEKGSAFAKLEPSVRYDVYVGGVTTTTDSSDAYIASSAEAVYTHHGDEYRIRIKGEDAIRLARLPLVYYIIEPSISLPHVWAAMPRHARAGSTIIISGEGFNGDEVLFGGVPSPHVETLGDDRLRVQVPETAASGPVDLLVGFGTLHQFLSGSSESGFHLDSPSQSTFKAGDLITANVLLNPSFEGAIGGEMQWLDPKDLSLFVRRLLPYPLTVFIDPAGNVIYAGDAATQYDLMSEKSIAGPSFAAGARAVLFDRSRDAIVVRGNTIERRAPSGSLRRSTSLAGVTSITAADLDADQCTLLYTAGKTVGAFDVCNFQPLPPIFTATTDQQAVRILPDGTLLIGDNLNTRIINRSGSVVTTIAGGASAIALSPDGSLAWLSGSSGIRSYDLRSGIASTPVTSLPWNTNVVALAVYEGWSSARGATSVASIPMTSPLFLALLCIALALAGARHSTAGL
jgi:hypothetical protein